MPKKKARESTRTDRGRATLARRLTKYEMAAMWLWGKDYAVSGLSAVEFWVTLSPTRKNLVRKMVDAILAAPFGTFNGTPSRPLREAPDA